MQLNTTENIVQQWGTVVHVAYARCQPENPANIADRFEKPLQNTDIHFRALTFVVFGYVYKHYIGAATSLNLCVCFRLIFLPRRRKVRYILSDKLVT